jgi:hypothetical protein
MSVRLPRASSLVRSIGFVPDAYLRLLVIGSAQGW